MNNNTSMNLNQWHERWGEKEINYVAKLAMEVLVEAGVDENYIADKENHFQAHTKLDSIIWINGSLDNKNKQRLADKLNITIQELETTCKTVAYKF